MSSVVIAGDTSGTVTLAAPAVSGTTTLTLPTTSGTIVTTSGSQTIEFADGSASTPSITNSGDTNTGMFFPAADTIAFSEGGTEAMRLDSAGNVGIGTASPAYKLDVSTDIRAGGSVIIGSSGTYVAGSIYSDANWGMIFRAKQASPVAADFMWANSADVERMRIDSSGVITSGLGGMQVISGTAVTASGTTVPFTGIPSWVKRITIMFDSISLNGAGEYLVQLGTSGGYVTSGYSSGCGYNQGNNVTRYATNTTGFLFTWDHGATSNLTGTMDLVKITGNTWVASGNSFAPTGATGTYNNAGSIALSGTLNSLRLLSTVGTDSWDAGTINILYE